VGTLLAIEMTCISTIFRFPAAQAGTDAAAKTEESFLTMEVPSQLS